MGEYAIIIETDQEVKIGVCNEMYYLRFDDIEKVKYNDTWRGQRFRLPYPNEDATDIGEYEPYDRYELLNAGYKPTKKMISKKDGAGKIGFRHANGYHFSLTCYHGAKLPKIKGIDLSWAGKKENHIVLKYVKYHYNESLDKMELRPIVGCLHCGRIWRETWDRIIPCVDDDQLKKRLAGYADKEC